LKISTDVNKSTNHKCSIETR